MIKKNILYCSRNLLSDGHWLILTSIPDITRLIVAELKEYRAKVGEIFAEFTQWLKDLPILQAVKEKVRLFTCIIR